MIATPVAAILQAASEQEAEKTLGEIAQKLAQNNQLLQQLLEHRLTGGSNVTAALLRELLQEDRDENDATRRLLVLLESQQTNAD